MTDKDKGRGKDQEESLLQTGDSPLISYFKPIYRMNAELEYRITIWIISFSIEPNPPSLSRRRRKRSLIFIEY